MDRNLEIVMLYCYDFHLQEVAVEGEMMVKHSVGLEPLMLKPPSALLRPLLDNIKTLVGLFATWQNMPT